jgi:hypothetical protein
MRGSMGAFCFWNGCLPEELEFSRVDPGLELEAFVYD